MEEKYDEVLSKAKFIFRDDQKSLDILKKLAEGETEKIIVPKKKDGRFGKLL